MKTPRLEIVAKLRRIFSLVNGFSFLLCQRKDYDSMSLRMIVECPKCGFSQPQDKYCASCGVDMETYRPATPPLWKVLLSHPAFHISIVFVFVFSSIFMIRQHQREEMVRRVEFLKGGPVVVQRQQTDAQLESQTLASNNLESTPTTYATTTTQTPATGFVATASENKRLTGVAASAVTNEGKTTTQPDNTPKLKIHYVKIDSELLEMWKTESQATGQFTTFDNATRGVLPEVKQKLKAPGVHVLTSVSKPLQAGGKPSSLRWFIGKEKKESEQEVGLTTDMDVAIKEGSFVVDGEVQRAFKEGSNPANPVTEKSFPITLEVPKGSGFFLSGILPRQIVTEGKEWDNPPNFLAIFKDDSFKNNETEFTLIFEFDTPEAQ